jgi:hypothetical protein
MVPLIIGIITFGIYKLFELFVRKKERLNIIEKLGDKLDASNLDFSLPSFAENTNKFTTLKFACLLLGIGLGLLIGYMICFNSIAGFAAGNYTGNAYEMIGIVYGAGVFTFGGVGLLIAFLVEMNYTKRKNDKA